MCPWVDTLRKQETVVDPKIWLGIGRFRQVYIKEQDKVPGQYLTSTPVKGIGELPVDWTAVHKIAVADSLHTKSLRTLVKIDLPTLWSGTRIPEPTSLIRAISDFLLS